LGGNWISLSIREHKQKKKSKGGKPARTFPQRGFIKKTKGPSWGEGEWAEPERRRKACGRVEPKPKKKRDPGAGE